MGNDTLPMRQRMDWVIAKFESEEGSGRIGFVMEPDPRRYEWIEREGEQMLFDRLERVLIPQRLLEEMAAQMDGPPLYYQPPGIKDALEYVDSRRSAIAQLLKKGATTAEAGQDPSALTLEQLAGDELGFAILSIDMVASTALAAAVEPGDYARILSTYLYEVSRLIPLFRGQVLKYTGDGLVAYFPEPSFNSMNDLAVDCALTIQLLLRDALRPALRDQGLREIEARIGIDSGEAMVMLVGSPTTKRHADIIGHVVNLAAKVQSAAAPGGVCLGEAAVSALHVSWRQRISPRPPDAAPDLRKADGSPYGLFEIS